MVRNELARIVRHLDSHIERRGRQVVPPAQLHDLLGSKADASAFRQVRAIVAGCARRRERADRDQEPLIRSFLIPSALIFDSNVEPGMPSFRAAPDGPDTRPLASPRAASSNAWTPGTSHRLDSRTACSGWRQLSPASPSGGSWSNDGPH